MRSSGLLYRLFSAPQSPNYKNLKKGDMPDGYEWQIFGQGPDPTGSERVVAHMKGERRQRWDRDSKRSLLENREVDALYLMARQNLRILAEDVEEMVRLVRGCKGAIASGMQDIGPPEGWREV